MWGLISKTCNGLPEVLNVIERLKASSTETLIILLAFSVIMIGLAVIAYFMLNAIEMRLIAFGTMCVSGVIFALALPTVSIRCREHRKKLQRKKIRVQRRLSKQRDDPKLE